MGSAQTAPVAAAQPDSLQHLTTSPADQTGPAHIAPAPGLTPALQSSLSLAALRTDTLSALLQHLPPAQHGSALAMPTTVLTSLGAEWFPDLRSWCGRQRAHGSHGIEFHLTWTECVDRTKSVWRSKLSLTIPHHGVSHWVLQSLLSVDNPQTNTSYSVMKMK